MILNAATTRRPPPLKYNALQQIIILIISKYKDKEVNRVKKSFIYLIRATAAFELTSPFRE